MVDEDYLVTVHDLEVLRGNTAIVRYIQFGPSMTSWSIRALFCLGQSIPFYCNKKGIDRPEQKRAWIDRDVIDGTHCMIAGHVILYNKAHRCYTPWVKS